MLNSWCILNSNLLEAVCGGENQVLRDDCGPAVLLVLEIVVVQAARGAHLLIRKKLKVVFPSKLVVLTYLYLCHPGQLSVVRAGAV